MRTKRISLINALLLIVLPAISVAENPFNELKNSSVSYFDLGMFKLRSWLKLPENDSPAVMFESQEVSIYEDGINILYDISVSAAYGHKNYGDLIEHCERAIEKTEMVLGFKAGSLRKGRPGFGSHFYPEGVYDDLAAKNIKKLSQRLAKYVSLTALICSDLNDKNVCVTCEKPLTSTKITFQK